MHKAKAPRILAVDDDAVVQQVLRYHFEQAGLSAQILESGRALLDSVCEETAVCLVDLKMPEPMGLDCLRRIKKTWPLTEVIILTQVNDARDAVEALREGACDYLTKPFDPNELLRAIRRAQRLHQVARENRQLKESLKGAEVPRDFLAHARTSQRLQGLLSRLSGVEETILLTGESGTGKTLLARIIHEGSARAQAPFITVSCPSLPRELLESEMFGHEKGAFTGAHAQRLGKAELAQGGTLFLDEIGELPLELQVKLLNFLQDREFFRVGGQKSIRSDVRVVAATNRDLEAQVDQGTFREDLFYRLNVLPVDVPALRERREDILPLADFFLKRAAAKYEGEACDLSEDARSALLDYGWPGNIRELENLIARAYVLRRNPACIDAADLPESLRTPPADPVTGAGRLAPPRPVGTEALAGCTLAELERWAIFQALERCAGNKAATARELGVTERTIYNKLKAYGRRTPVAVPA